MSEHSFSFVDSVSCWPLIMNITPIIQVCVVCVAKAVEVVELVKFMPRKVLVLLIEILLMQEQINEHFSRF